MLGTLGHFYSGEDDHDFTVSNKAPWCFPPALLPTDCHKCIFPNEGSDQVLTTYGQHALYSILTLLCLPQDLHKVKIPHFPQILLIRAMSYL